MKTTWFWTVVLGISVAGMLAAGCGRAVDTSGTGGTMQDPLVGSWLSQGADVAPLLAAAPFNYTQITADFHADGTYDVVGLDASNKETDFTGTWQADASSVAGIFTIALAQTTPSVVQSSGIYRIDTTVTPNRMRYEVVQTQPTNGLTPPTPEAGFGSTVFNGKPIDTLVQNFSRQ